MPAGMVPNPISPPITVSDTNGDTSVLDLISNKANVNNPEMLTLENTTAAATPGILFKQSNGFASGGSPGILQFNGPDFGGTQREYAALTPAQNYQKVGALYADYEANFINNNTFYNIVLGAVATQYPVPFTPITAGLPLAIGTTSVTLANTTGWPVDGAKDLYGFLASTSNGNNLDEEFVHITFKTGTTITLDATKAAHGGTVTLSILDPTQGPAIYHAPANGAFYSGAANGTNPTPVSLGAGASPFAGLYLNPNVGPEGAGTTYQITKNDFLVVAQKTATYTLPPIQPASSTVPNQGQVICVFANVGTLTLNTAGGGDVFNDGTTSKSIVAPHSQMWCEAAQAGAKFWVPLSSV